MKKKESKMEYGTVSLPIPLIKKIKVKMKGTGIPSVSSYVSFVMRQILSSKTNSEKKVLENNEEEEIRARLKTLGYI